MFAHVGTRALWPAIFFLPWLSVGIAYLFQWLRHRERRLAGSIRPSAGRLRIIGLGLLLIGAPLARADPVPEVQPPCLGLAQEQARMLGNELFEQGAYRRAGECYQAAEEYELANRAFLRAVQPESMATARQLSDQREQARTMLHTVAQAFHPGH
jgi:hypothetical protein